MLPLFLCHHLGVICPAACDTYQQLEFPSNGYELRAG